MRDSNRTRPSADRAAWASQALPRGGRAARTAVLLLGLALAPAVALGGCYPSDSGDPDEGQANAAAPAAEVADGGAGDDAEGDGEGAGDLPGDIPPALDDSESLGPGRAQASGAPGDGTDDRVERRGLTAFTGAGSRGQYLTEQVAMCVQCHSPKDDLGRVDPDRKFEGGTIPVASPYPAREWAIEAPALAGLEFYGRDELVRLLTEGIARDGEPPQPPMPPFRMERSDAEAIYDYLSGLPHGR